MAAKDEKQILSATEFTPLDAARNQRKFRISSAYLALGLLVIVATLVLVYLSVARAVVFRLDPGNTEINVSGISFHIGDNFLLLPGNHKLLAEAEGYRSSERSFSVSNAATQEIDIVLEPLPGNLNVLSALDGIQVSIDNQAVGTVPGTLEGISRGQHKFQFSKHRYFPQEQAVDIEGLGRTQTLTVSLQPAWGQMNFSSVPPGADLHVDDQLVGKTPLTTEILETGSSIRLGAPGYKTWRKTVSVKAGTEQTYPSVELVVADGALQINSTPSGANITVDRVFKGTTPLTVSLSPLNDHQIELYLEGYRKATRRVTIEPEQQTSLNVPLAAIIGSIKLVTDPDDAEVLVDGRVYKRGSQTLELTATEHSLTIRKTGYETRTIAVTPRPGQDQHLEVNLLTNQQAYWASRPPQVKGPLGSTLKLFRPDSVFMLGAPRREPGRRANEAQRSVRLLRPFYLGTREVSNAEFRRFRAGHSSSAIRGHTLDMDNQPAASVSWQDAALFCNWLSQQDGLPLFYVVENGLVNGINPDSHGYRLPTEAEWAWAAKINLQETTDIFPWDNELYPPEQLSGNYADLSAAEIIPFTLSNYNDQYPVSAPVGSFKPNGKGLYDMSGNVAEWTNDYYEIRPSRGEPDLDPVGPETGSRHVIRGASWALGSRTELRLSYRDAGVDGRLDVGFRIARYVDKAGVEQ